MTSEETKIFGMEYETFHNLLDFLSPRIWFLSDEAPGGVSSSLNKLGWFFSPYSLLVKPS